MQPENSKCTLLCYSRVHDNFLKEKQGMPVRNKTAPFQMTAPSTENYSGSRSQSTVMRKVLKLRCRRKAVSNSVLPDLKIRRMSAMAVKTNINACCVRNIITMIMPKQHIDISFERQGPARPSQKRKEGFLASSWNLVWREGSQFIT